MRHYFLFSRVSSVNDSSISTRHCKVNVLNQPGCNVYLMDRKSQGVERTWIHAGGSGVNGLKVKLRALSGGSFWWYSLYYMGISRSQLTVNLSHNKVLLQWKSFTFLLFSLFYVILLLVSWLNQTAQYTNHLVNPQPIQGKSWQTICYVFWLDACRNDKWVCISTEYMYKS